jgi:hypothetical protein
MSSWNNIANDRRESGVGSSATVVSIERAVLSAGHRASHRGCHARTGRFRHSELSPFVVTPTKIFGLLMLVGDDIKVGAGNPARPCFGGLDDRRQMVITRDESPKIQPAD